MMHDNQVKIKKEKGDVDVAQMSDENYYPYGTSLSIDDELVDELKADSFAAGDIVEIKAYAFIESKSETSSNEHSSKTVRLQLTSMSLEREADNDGRAKRMYGDE